MTSGDTLWTSAKLEAPSEDMSYKSISATVGGKDYLVAWTSGTTDGDVVTQGARSPRSTSSRPRAPERR